MAHTSRRHVASCKSTGQVTIHLRSQDRANVEADGGANVLVVFHDNLDATQKGKIKMSNKIETGEGWRLLKDGDIITQGDHYLDAFTNTWQPSTRFGVLYNSAYVSPMRRICPPQTVVSPTNRFTVRIGKLEIDCSIEGLDDLVKRYGNISK